MDGSDTATIDKDITSPRDPFAEIRLLNTELQ
jgi:hypothetical protein